MQSTTTRGVRHLLVSAGVISLVLSIATPAALSCADEEISADGDKVKVRHDGRVLEVETGALEAHVGHGDEELDAEALEGEACAEIVIVKDPVVVKDPGSETSGAVGSGEQPATPAQPIPGAQPRPVVIISDDAVTRPVTPASPAVTSVADNEVLGAVTTRIPTGAGMVAASVQTAGGITVLAATGAGTTWMLVTLGLVLLLAGLGLQVSARRRVRSADVGA